MIESFLRQTEHRLWAERVTIVSNIRRSWAGLICAFLLTGGFLAGGVFVASIGHPGAMIATASVIGMVKVFITGAQAQKEERIEKAKIMSGKKLGE